MLAEAFQSMLSLRPKPARVTNAQTITLRDDPGLWDFGWGNTGRRAASGVQVTHKLAMSIGPIMGCVGMLSGDNASSTLHVHFTHKSPGQDTIDQHHPADRVCSRQWNDTTSAFKGWSQFGQHLTLYGRAYALIERDRTSLFGGQERDRDWGRVTALYNLLPDRTMECQAQKDGLIETVMNPMFLSEGEKYYTTEVGGGLWAIRWQDMLHVDWMNVFPCPFPMLELLRDEIGHKLAARGFQSKFFSNGAQAGGFVSVPPEMTKKSRENLKRILHKKATNEDSWFKVQVLQDGAKFHQVTIDPKSSDMGVIDEQVARNIAMAYRIPAQKLGLKGSDSYGAGESAHLSYVNGVLNHLGKAIAGECYIKLLSPKTRQATPGEAAARCIKHDYSELTRPDWNSRVESLVKLKDAMVINSNDVLFALSWPLRDDEDAEKYQNSNTTPGDTDDDEKDRPEEEAESGDETEGSDEQTQGSARRRLHAEAVGRAAQKLTNLAANRCKKLSDFETLVTNRFGEFHGIFQDELGTTLELTHGAESDVVLAAARDIFFDSYTGAITSTVMELDFSSGFEAKTLRAAVRATGAEFQATITETLADGVLAGSGVQA